MTIYDIFKRAVDLGVKNDFRSRAAVLSYYWQEIIKGRKGEKFVNPYADTGIVWVNDIKNKITTVVAGIDLDLSEILAVRGKYKKENTLFIIHHPQGRPDATFHHILKIQLGNLESQGININGLEKHFDQLVKEMSNEILGSNPNRLPETLCLLGCSCLAVHTPIDNMAARYLEKLIFNSGVETLEDCLDFLLSVPEYRLLSMQYDLNPKIFSGQNKNKLGKVILTEFTGGEEGPIEVLRSMKRSGVDTLIVMHMSAKAIKEARKLKLNVICAGDIGSDSMGLNLFCDIMEKEGVKIVPVGGFLRRERKNN